MMDRCLSENGILEAMDTWPKYGCMPDGRFIRLTKENEKDYVPYVHYDDMVKVVKGIPSLDVAPVVHAHWIADSRDCEYTCSHCGDVWRGDFDLDPYDDHFYYCPNCGAKMDEEVPE
ncbi:MAG: hypothetical protein VZR30_04535 [Acutalibacteraceae bacterium]|nr:hypothetical protein [Acutalibacteraceae bacterium]